MIKWLFDKIVGSLGLIRAAPIMLVVAIAIKLNSKGPVLFKQTRHGFNNELIEVHKFRSLYADQADPAADKPVTRDDPRVTRVGRFIRKTSLDELPQLFNVVFSGNLSLIGPRPHAMHSRAQDRFFDEAVDGYFARHRVKPGITGWAQIHGWRGETNSQEKIQQRVEHDLYYIENWSILLDIYIFARRHSRLPARRKRSEPNRQLTDSGLLRAERCRRSKAGAFWQPLREIVYERRAKLAYFDLTSITSSSSSSHPRPHLRPPRARSPDLTLPVLLGPCGRPRIASNARSPSETLRVSSIGASTKLRICYDQLLSIPKL